MTTFVSSNHKLTHTAYLLTYLLQIYISACTDSTTNNQSTV